MKHTNTCPKCGGADIIFIEGQAGAYGTGNNIQVGMTVFSAVKVHRCLCCGCGYSEEWVDKDDLPRLKEAYPSLNTYVKPEPFRIF